VSALALYGQAPELRPSLHAYGSLGTSSADHPGSFAPGGHDPNKDESVQLQSLEPGLSLIWGEHLQGFVTGTAFTDADDDLDWEWEEYFLSLTNLPGGFEVRGGLILNRVGFHNPTHLHSWTTVDAPLPHALFLGEDGLGTRSGEINWYSPGQNPIVLTASFGQRPDHDHDHGHDHEESGFSDLESVRVQDDVWTVAARGDWVIDDFNRWSFAGFGGGGDSESGESSWFAGAGVQYLWRENGLEAGGRAVRWRAEAIILDGTASAHEHHDHEEDHHEEDHHDGHEEDHHEDDHHEYDHDHDHEEGVGVEAYGISTEILYEATERIHPYVRLDYVDGLSELDAPEWLRISVGTTFILNPEHHLQLRLQANADERGDESEQSLWLQLGFSWGGPEVR
jgi:hypothetical protein